MCKVIEFYSTFLNLWNNVHPKFENDTADHMYSMLLLYTPFKNERELIPSDSTLEEQFRVKVGEDERSSKLELLEQKLFPLLKSF